MKFIHSFIMLFLITALSKVWAASSGCSISDDGLLFGNYNPFSKQVKTIKGKIYLKCQNGIGSYTISLKPGLSHSYAVRQLHNLLMRDKVLNYNLYTDATYTTVWGDGTQNTQNITLSGKGLCTQQNPCQHVIYGKIYPSQKNVWVGKYVDAVGVQVDF